MNTLVQIVILSYTVFLLNILLIHRQDPLYVSDPDIASKYKCIAPSVPPSLPLQLHSSSRKRQRSLQRFLPTDGIVLDNGGLNEHGEPMSPMMSTMEISWLRKSQHTPSERSQFNLFNFVWKESVPDPSHPEMWDYHSQIKHAEVSKAATSKGPLFVLAWTTASHTFTSRQVAVLESIFFHHPNAQVSIYSNFLSLNDAPFFRYINLGYSLFIERYSNQILLRKLFEIKVARPEYSDVVNQVELWMQYWDKWQSGKYFYSHVTDLMRFIVLCHQGGTWIDFDAVVVQSFDGYRNAVGRDIAGIINQGCSWCLGVGDLYLAPGVLINWDQYHPMLMRAMAIGFDSKVYDSNCFNCVGPKAMTMAYLSSGELTFLVQDTDIMTVGEENYWKNGGPVGENRRGDQIGNDGSIERLKHPKDDVHILESFQLYPVRWDHVAQYAVRSNSLEISDRYFAAVRSTALSFHMFGHMTNKLSFAENSVLQYVVNSFRILGEFGEFAHQLAVMISAPQLIAVLAPASNQRAELLGGISLKVPTSFASSAAIPKFNIVIESTSCEISFALNNEKMDAKSSILQYSGTFHQIQVALSSILWHTDSSKCLPIHHGQLSVVYFSDVETIPSGKKVIEIVHINDLLTISLQTFGNFEQVDTIIDSIRSQLPEVVIRVTNDGPFATRPRYARAGVDPFIEYIHVGFDVGLGHKRQRLHQNVKTKYELIMNDNMKFGATSDIARWVVECLKKNIDFSMAQEPKEESTARGTDEKQEKEETEKRLEEEFLFKTANGPYLARHASIEQLRGWNESLKYEADSNLLQRAVQANMNIVKDVGIGFVKLEFDINLKNPWHLWFRENSYRTEFNGSCLTGTQGVNCETCDDRHAGFLCAQCNLEHFGPRCQPCNCSESMVCSATIVGDGKCRSRADIMFVNIVDSWCSLLFLAAASFALVCCLICPRRITVEKMH